jgi:hypothetical protein
VGARLQAFAAKDNRALMSLVRLSASVGACGREERGQSGGQTAVRPTG